jgi:hypothetical protein
MRTNVKFGLGAVAIAALILATAQPSAAAAAWKCGKKHCFWTEGYAGPVPDFAKMWPNPSGPGCYYVLRAKMKWTEYCPSTEPMQ